MNLLKSLIAAALLSSVAVASFAQNARSGTLPGAERHVAHRGHVHHRHHHHHRRHRA